MQSIVSTGVRRADARRRPRIHVAEQDYDRLAYLAEHAAGPGARLLERELERAVLVDPKRHRRPFVRLYSTVTFYEPTTGQARRITLTPAAEADIDQGRLSVTAPVGAALLGLAIGDVFVWRGEDGREREVAVLRIEAEPGPDAAA
ncbi:MAG: GreA/GreB family elongation factor [Phenylobacterium sp.]